MVKSREQDDLLGGPINDSGDSFFGSKPAGGDAVTSDSQTPEADATPDLLGGPSAAAPQKEGYVVLARKYRPQTFDQIVGQENVQQALRGAIATGQISHAYLFSGPRGTGKTSTARILAKAVNCQEGGPRPDPCGRCSSCRSITAGSSLDVIEIDAASNTGVDNIRELRSGVVLAPFSLYKVYIVDEVHMLSNQAFNALLKTLEEPPSQVIFILATTELNKVPETIISRCQSFAFRRFSNNELQGQLGKILDTEIKQRDIKIDPDDRERILELVARNAEGGMRDAQVALDQVLVFSRGTLDFETVRRFLGLAESEALDNFVTAIYKRDVDTLLTMVEEFFASGQDLELFVKSICEHARDLLIVRSAPNRSELLNVSEDRYAALRELANELPPGFLVNLSSVFLKLAEEMKSSPQPRFAMELTLLKLTALESGDDLQSLAQRVAALEKALAGGSPPASGGGSAALPQPQARSATAVPPATYQATGDAPVRREADIAIAEAPQMSAPISPVPQPVASANTFTVDAPSSPEALLKCLQTHTADRSHLLHITLLDFARITQFDGRTATLEVSDPFGYAHLSAGQSQSVLKEIAREVCGCDIILKLELVQSAVPPAPVPLPEPPARSETVAAIIPPSPVIEPVQVSVSEPIQPGAMETPETETAPNITSSDIEPSNLSVYVSPELRRKAMTEVKGEAFRKLLENHDDLKELVEKVKDAFGVSDSQLQYRVHGI